MLTLKTQKMDNAPTYLKKITKSLRSNIPTLWGSLVWYHFPLTEDVHYDGISLDKHYEMLFNCPPLVLQTSIYKKNMNKLTLGQTDINLDALSGRGGGELEKLSFLGLFKKVLFL